MLLAALGPRLEAVAVRLTRDPDAAKDVVQNAFLKVLRHGDRFRGDARVSTWMHRIVCNEALMWLRTERRRNRLLAIDGAPGEVADLAPDPAESVSALERRELLREGLLRLPHEERDVVVRCGLRGQSYAEYGARRGLHPGAVKSRAFRGRRRLSRLLRGPGEPDPLPDASR